MKCESTKFQSIKNAMRDRDSARDRGGVSGSTKWVGVVPVDVLGNTIACPHAHTMLFPL